MNDSTISTKAAIPTINKKDSKGSSTRSSISKEGEDATRTTTSNQSKRQIECTTSSNNSKYLQSLKLHPSSIVRSLYQNSSSSLIFTMTSTIPWSNQLEQISKDLMVASTNIQSSFKTYAHATQTQAKCDTTIATTSALLALHPEADPVTILSRISSLKSTLERLKSECLEYVEQRPFLAEEVTGLLLDNFLAIEEVSSRIKCLYDRLQLQHCKLLFIHIHTQKDIYWIIFSLRFLIPFMHSFIRYATLRPFFILNQIRTADTPYKGQESNH